jgi:diadenosine tetraphosphatase ApaH/serine/threonine PP2A family protein phosphatase
MEGTKMALFHGSPRDPLSEYIFPGISSSQARELILEGGANLVLLGHTHMPMVYTFEGQMLANPGSVGQPRDGDPRASFGMLNILDDHFSFDIIRVKYDVDSVTSKITQACLPPFLAERLYDGM